MDSADVQVETATQTKSKREQEYTVRVQAQGGGLEKSVPINLKRPVTAAEAIAALHQLKASLSKADLNKRDEAFQKAEVWIRRVAAGGGIGPIGSKSFHNRQFEGTDIRVDVEIIRGPTNLVP